MEVESELLKLSREYLDELNQLIWEDGFSDKALVGLRNFVKEINDGTKILERIPQAQQSGLSRGSEILTAAGVICRGCPETKSEFREIYDTDDLIGEGSIQESLIEIWARIEGCWFEYPEDYLISISDLQDRGTESEVYFDVRNALVRKLISLKHYNVLRLALDRIIIHNAVFPDDCLRVVGFGRNAAGEFVVVVEQPYCQGDVVSEEERANFMYGLGFVDAGMDYGMHLNYRTPNLYIGDLNDYNMIKGENGIHVIDADCRLNTVSLGCGGSYVLPEVGIDFSKKCFLNL